MFHSGSDSWSCMVLNKQTNEQTNRNNCSATWLELTKLKIGAMYCEYLFWSDYSYLTRWFSYLVPITYGLLPNAPSCRQQRWPIYKWTGQNVSGHRWAIDAIMCTSVKVTVNDQCETTIVKPTLELLQLIPDEWRIFCTSSV